MESDDAAGLLLRFDGGARGVCTISQVSAGRRNRLAEIDGDESALAWASDDPDHLWIGHRGRPNEVVEKDPALLTPEGAAAAAFPAGMSRATPTRSAPCSLPCTPTSLPAHHHRRSRTTPRSPTATTSSLCATPSPPAHQGAWTSIDRG